MKFFQPNISGAGRIYRAVLSLVLLAATIYFNDLHWIFRIALLGAAIVGAFEALRGWCLLRACGIRTRI